MKELNKVLIISLFFLILFFYFGLYCQQEFGVVNNTIDFQTHFDKVNDWSVKPDYPVLYHVLFMPFNGNELLFYTANLFLICLIIPISLFFLTKNYWSTILYFMGVSLPHLWLYGATYPQALTFFFLITYFFYRKTKHKLFAFVVCGLLISLTHNFGLKLCVLILIAEIIEFFIKTNLKKETVVCFINYFKLKLLKVSPAVVLGVQYFETIWEYLFFIVTQISPITWFYAKKIFYEPFYLILVLISLLFILTEARIISLAQLVLVIVASQNIKDSKHKKGLIILLLFQLIFFLIEFMGGTVSLINFMPKQ